MQDATITSLLSDGDLTISCLAWSAIAYFVSGVLLNCLRMSRDY